MLLLERTLFHKYGLCVVRDSSHLHLTFVAFCLLSVIRKQQLKRCNYSINQFRASVWILDRFFVISIEFLLLCHRCSSLRNIPSSNEQGEMTVSAGYSCLFYRSDCIIEVYVKTELTDVSLVHTLL